MTARTAGRRRQADVDEPDEDEALLADGVAGRIVERIMDNPAMSGGLIVMALTAAAVVSNALFLQKAQHPEPWFATRPAPEASAPTDPAVTVPDPRPRALAAVEPPTPRPAPEPALAPAAAAPAALAPALIADLQRALSDRGLYKGKIDGISGSRTRAAITAYEQSQGLPVTGQPSPAVLDHIVTASLEPAGAPAAAAAPPAPTIEDIVAAPAPAPAPAPAVAEPAPVAEMEVYPPPAEAEAEAAPPVATAAEEAAAEVTSVSLSEPAAAPGAASAADERTYAIQRALNRAGYGPVPEDGVAGETTAQAIRRFELDNGLPITGAPGEALVERLTLIGAMEAA